MPAAYDKPALLPLYVTRFRCVGDRCEDTCCNGWTITVDRPTYDGWRQLPADGFRDELLGTLQVADGKSPAPPGAHAWFKPKPGTRECPMLSGGLCRVQQRAGEASLSDTCFSYPRTTRTLGTSLTQALSLSCPEAARLALLAPDAFDFVGGNVHGRPSTETRTVLPKGIHPDAANGVRLFCLQLVRSEGAPLWVRLAVLGLFCERLTALLESGKAEDVPGFLASFEQALASPGFLDALEQVPARHAEQAQVFASLLHSGLQRPPSPHQGRVQDAVARGLGAAEGESHVDAARLISAYKRGVERLPEVLDAHAPKLLENYVLNELLREGFPFDAATPSAHFLDLVIRFGMVRLMLAARCSGETPPDAAALVETVQVFCRRFQHDVEFAKQARASFHARGWDSIAKVFGYLRA